MDKNMDQEKALKKIATFATVQMAMLLSVPEDCASPVLKMEINVWMITEGNMNQERALNKIATFVVVHMAMLLSVPGNYVSPE